MTSRLLSAAFVAFVALAPATFATARADTVVLVNVGEVTVQTKEMTVVSVNPETRELIVKAMNGDQFAYQIAPEVGPLTNIVPNNHLLIGVVPGAVTDIQKADSGKKGVISRTTIDDEMFGKLPEGFFGTAVVENAVLVSVDTGARTVMFEGADGVVRTMQATNDEVADDLANVQPGDLCQISYLEAMSVVVQP